MGSTKTEFSKSSLPRSTRVIYAVFDFVARYNKKKILGWTVILVVLGILSTGFSVIKKEQKGLRVRFGKVVDEDMEPGIHYYVPFIEKIHKRKVWRITRHGVSTQGADGGAAFTILSGDPYMLEVDVSIQYRISHLRSFLFSTENPLRILTLLTRERLVNIISQNSIDLILTSNRDRIEERLFKELLELVAPMNIGLDLLSFSLVDVRPIKEMIPSFRDVNDAVAEKIQAVINSNTRKESFLARTRGQAQALLSQAKSKAQARLEQAKAGASAFLDLLSEYERRPGQVAITKYWDRMRSIFQEASLSMVNSSEASRFDINILEDEANPIGISLDEPKPSPGHSDGHKVSKKLEERPLFSLVKASGHGKHSAGSAEKGAMEPHLRGGRFHNSSRERDHKKEALMRSLIFDSGFVFKHRDVAQRGEASQKKYNEKTHDRGSKGRRTWEEGGR